MLHKAYFCNLEELHGANTRKVPHAHRLQKRFVKQQKHIFIFCNCDLQGANSRKILHGRLIAEDGRSPTSFTSPPSLVPPHFGSRQCPGPQYPSNMAHMSQWLERDSESSGAWKRRTTGGIPWRFQEAHEGDAFHWVTGYIRHADRGLDIIASRASVFV